MDADLTRLEGALQQLSTFFLGSEHLGGVEPECAAPLFVFEQRLPDLGLDTQTDGRPVGDESLTDGPCPLRRALVLVEDGKRQPEGRRDDVVPFFTAEPYRERRRANDVS